MEQTNSFDEKTATCVAASVATHTSTNTISNQTKAKPITDLPNTLGKALDLRLRVEKRIEAIHAAHQKKNPFWNTNTEPVSADEIVQTVLDRHQVLFQLNEIITSVSALKKSAVVVPSFLEDAPTYTLSLGQLRDAESCMLPYLVQVHDSVISQMTTVSNQCNQHDARVEHDLKEELLDLEKQFKNKTEKAKHYNEILPNDDDLKADKATASRRAETKKSVRVDTIGVRDFIGTLKSFISLLEEKRNDKIDECNAESIDKELVHCNDLVQKASNNIRNGVHESHVLIDSKNPDHINVSVADLMTRTKELSALITNAIPCVNVVSFQKGQNAKIENPHVESGKQQLVEIFHNIYVLMQYRQAHRTVMALRFTALHPLTHLPCSLDAMVRLGYDSGSVTNPTPITYSVRSSSKPKGRGGRGRGARDRNTRHQPVEAEWGEEELDQTTTRTSSDDSHPTLFGSLSRLEALLNAAEQNMNTEREVHEVAVRKSVSDKQEARSKSGAVMKGGELEEIAKAVRASDVINFHLSENLDHAKQRVTKLLEDVQSLQSAERKSANAILRVTVPQYLPMKWVDQTDGFSGW